jgi:hypothetical protein
LYATTGMPASSRSRSAATTAAITTDAGSRARGVRRRDAVDSGGALRDRDTGIGEPGRARTAVPDASRRPT